MSRSGCLSPQAARWLSATTHQPHLHEIPLSPKEQTVVFSCLSSLPISSLHHCSIVITILKLYVLGLRVEYLVHSNCLLFIHSLDDLGDHRSFSSAIHLVSNYCIEQRYHSIETTLSVLIKHQFISHGAYHRVGDLTRSPLLS